MGSRMIGARLGCIPTTERLTQLYALGYDSQQMAAIIENELGDIDLSRVTPDQIKEFIRNNKELLDRAKLDITKTCRETIIKQTELLFVKSQDVELRMVNSFISKLNNILKSLDDLDINERDDMGNYINMSRFFVLLEAAEKLQSRIAKVVGTDAVRDVEVYRQKMELKQKANENDLMPRYPKGAVIESPTKFIE